MLALYLGITLGNLGGPYRMLDIEYRSAVYKTNALPHCIIAPILKNLKCWKGDQRRRKERQVRSN